MSKTQRMQDARRRTLTTSVALLVAAAVLPGLVACRSPESPSSDAAPTGMRVWGHAFPPRVRGDIPGALPAPRDGTVQARLGIADGELPDGVTVFDGRYPGVSDLIPDLLGALRRAATTAASDGVQLFVDSGWRSRRYQEELFRQAVSKYGSTERAAEWVARPGTSPHENGEAVDIGPSDAASWLAAHGAFYGLCQIYENEPWHYELRPDAVGRGCPPMYADPTHDPRLRQ